MTDSGAGNTRRMYLKRLLGGGLVTATAGCQSSGDDGEATETPSQTRPRESPTASPTNAATDTPTATPDRSPDLPTTTATPVKNGQALEYHVIAEDDDGLQYVAVTYGDQTHEWEDLDRTIDESGQFTDLGHPEDGQVVYIARDTANQETRTAVTPDEEPPTLPEFQTKPTETSGEIQVLLQGQDNEGLEELALLLDGNPQLQHDGSGQNEIAVDTTIDVSDNATVGEENSLTAMLEDWNGNQVEAESDTYVRKFDKMDDTRLSFGTVYEAYNWDFNEGKRLEGNDNRIPEVGQYGRPIEEWIFNRHMDQMQGHGTNRLMLTCSGYDDVIESNERFLDAELVNEMQIEPFYNFLKGRWGEGYPASAESYKDDLIEPTMTWIRDNILSRENASTHNGRPVMQIWGPNLLARDYQHDKIMDEFGSYESFVDEMRTLLSVDGRDPYLVGGANWYGATGYPDRGEEIHQQFDAVTTWTAGGAWQDNEDNETTKEEVLEYVEDNFQGHREFTDEHDMDFVPMVFPGFNETKGDRRHPRSPELLEELLELAEEYRTTEMVNHAAWNWEEMTTLEPGIFNEGPFGDESYGTAYLDVVKEFQQQ